MKTKKLLGWFCLTLFMSGIAVAQGLYVKAGAGYNLGMPAMQIGEQYTENYYSTSLTSYSTETDEGVYDSFGKGLGLDAALGYAGETFGFEVGIQYKPESTIELKDQYNSFTTSSPYFHTSTNDLKSSMLAISPCLVFKTDMGLYARAGVVLGFPKIKNEYKSEYSGSMSGTTEETYELSGNMALGYTGAVGVAIGGGGVKLYLEVNFVSLSWAPKQAEITAYKVNGVDQLSSISNKTITFEDTYTYDSRSSSSSSSSLKTYLPFSSVGLKAGIAIGF